MFPSTDTECPICGFKVGGWTCRCGTQNAPDAEQCSNCNEPKPTHRCSCGCQLPEGQVCPCCTSRHFRHRRCGNKKDELVLANCVTIDLPDYFVQSRSSPKIVGVEKITVYRKQRGEWQPVLCSVHSDSFARSNANFDFFICQGNVEYYGCPREFTLGDTEPTFSFWLKDATGNVIDVYPTKTKVIMELVLKF